MSRHHSSLVAAPLDNEDLLQEILLRLPPQPSSLPRASLVCKRWHNILSDPQFLLRFRKHHRKPPLLGFFDKEWRQVPVFTPMLDLPDRIPAARFALPENLLSSKSWDTLNGHLIFSFFGCRHGIALVLDHIRREAILWDPLTGFQSLVSFPPGFGEGKDNIIRSAAVFAAGDNLQVHADCHLCPFKLVFACHDAKHTKASVCMFESNSGVWGDIISTATTYMLFMNRPSILVGNTLCWLLDKGDILEFDFQRLTLAVIEKPTDIHDTGCHYAVWTFQILRGEDNGLGLAVLSRSKLSIQLWARKYDRFGGDSWVLQNIVQLDELFSRPLRPGAEKVVLMPGYDEDKNVIFLSSTSHDFILDVESMQFNYIGRRECKSFRMYYPYRNLYTAGI